MVRFFRTRLLVRTGLFVLLALFWTTDSAAELDTKTFTLRGRVDDVVTGQPVYLANVRVTDTNLGGTTDIDGHFVIEFVPMGTYTLMISRIGYETIVREAINVDEASSGALHSLSLSR